MNLLTGASLLALDKSIYYLNVYLSSKFSSNLDSSQEGTADSP